MGRYSNYVPKSQNMIMMFYGTMQSQTGNWPGVTHQDFELLSLWSQVIPHWIVTEIKYLAEQSEIYCFSSPVKQQRCYPL